LRVQEVELVVQEWQLAERQMQELVVAQKRLEDIHVSFVSEAQSVWSFLCQADAALAPLDFNPIRPGIRHLKLASCSRSLTRLEPRCPSQRRSSEANWSRRSVFWLRW
jgi:hypothetical protein